jgi:hypothetical protein
MNFTKTLDPTQQSTIKSSIKGWRRLSNFFWCFIITSAGLGFFLTGLSSFLKVNFGFISSSNTIAFIPQGIILVFYGTVGLVLGLFLLLSLWWDVGFGYNEFNKDRQEVTIFRKGFPGKNRKMFLTFKFEELKSIKMLIKDGLNPKRQLFLCLVDKREIPLMGNEEPMTLNKIEAEALTLAKYLNIFLETG